VKADKILLDVPCINSLNLFLPGTEFSQESPDLCLLPIKSHKKLIGIMGLIHPDGGDNDKTKLNEMWLHSIGEHIGVALERSRLIEDLHETNEKLKENLRLKSEFINIASHELRTPVTAIKNSLDLIYKKTRDNLTETQLKFIEIAMESIERLTRHIENLLDLSKFEKGKFHLVLRPEDIGDIIEESVEFLKEEAIEKTHKLELAVDENLPLVLADRRLLSRVISNLLDNAIKFTPDGGIIRIRACRDREKENFILVCVEDSGPAIPSMYRDSIFDKFSQLEESSERLHQGLGLGLAISKEIVEAHGGRIWLEKNPDGGNSFRFTVPISE